MPVILGCMLMSNQMKILLALQAIAHQLQGIDPEDLTRAEKNIMRIITKAETDTGVPLIWPRKEDSNV